MLSVATFILLILMIVPHHHHDDGTACIIIEVCEHDNAIDDEHTHHGEAPDNGHNSKCLVEAKFVIPHPNDDENKYKISTNKDNNSHLFSAYFLVASFIDFDSEYRFLKIEYEEHFLLYNSAEANQYHGLRAPPVILLS
jgi:hypothetical protein